MMKKNIFLLAVELILIFLISCGYKAPEFPKSAVSAAKKPKAIVDGNAVDAPVKGGSVYAFDITTPDLLKINEPLGESSVTDENGRFSLNIAHDNDELGLRLTGGTYIDEWTGETIVLDADDFLECWISDFEPGKDDTRQITGVTTFTAAYARFLVANINASAGSAISTANSMFQILVNKIRIDKIHPFDWTQKVPDNINKPTESLIYGLYITGISGYANSLSVNYNTKATSIDVINAISRDMENDGIQNGLDMDAIVYCDKENNLAPLDSGALRYEIPLYALRFLITNFNQSNFTYQDFFDLFQDISKNSSAIFDNSSANKIIQHRDIVPVEASISGSVEPGCPDGTVQAYKYLDTGVAGEYVGNGTVDGSSNFSIDFYNYTGYMLLKATGCDRMQQGQYMSVLIGVEEGKKSSVIVSPFTTMLHSLTEAYIAKDKTTAFGQSESAFDRHFTSIDFVLMKPKYLDQTITAFDNDFESKYGLLLMALEELATDYISYLNEEPEYNISKNASYTIFDLVQALVDDFSDSQIDGKKDGNSINIDDTVFLSPYTIRHLLARAVIKVIQSAKNQAGLTYNTAVSFLIDMSLDTQELFQTFPTRHYDDDAPVPNFSVNQNECRKNGDKFTIQVDDLTAIQTFTVEKEGVDITGDDESGDINTFMYTLNGSDGIINFDIYVEDSAGNNTFIKDYSVCMDNTGPTIQFPGLTDYDNDSATYEYFTKEDALILEVRAKDCDDTLICARNEEIYADGALVTNNQYVEDVSGWTEGKYDIEFTANDGLGNTDDTTDYTLNLYYDKTAPEFKDKDDEGASLGDTDYGIRYFIQAQLDNVSVCETEEIAIISTDKMLKRYRLTYPLAVTYDYYLNDVFKRSDTVTNNALCISKKDIPEVDYGISRIVFKTQDLAGNESTITHTIDIREDSGPPAITYSDTYGKFVNGSGYTFTVTAKDDISTIKDFTVKVGQAVVDSNACGLQECTVTIAVDSLNGTINGVNIGNISDADIYFDVEATDNNDISAIDTFLIKTDNTPPEIRDINISNITILDGKYYTTGSSVTVTGSAIDSRALGVEISCNGGAYQTTTAINCSKGVQEGENTLTVSVKDSIGNQINKVYTIYRDTTPPLFHKYNLPNNVYSTDRFPQGKNGVVNGNGCYGGIDFYVQARDEGSGLKSFQYTLDFGARQDVVTPLRITNLSDGNPAWHYVSFFATDNLGYESMIRWDLVVYNYNGACGIYNIGD